MRKGILVILSVLAAAWANPAIPCTIVFATSREQCLVANNLDCSNVFPRVWFVPPSEGQYGRFCYGTDRNERIAEGGMNDQGLFVGVNALDKDTGWKPDPDLPDWVAWEGWFESGVPDGILAKCASVDEAAAIFRGYNLFTLGKVKFLLADKSGASVVVEWGAGGLTFASRGQADYQVSTNFVTSDYGPEDVPCYRYTLARQMLDSSHGAPSVDSLRRVLSATHLEFQTPTVLSTICDLVTGDILVYYFHHFEEGIAFKLHHELKKGRAGYLLSDLAAIKPYVAKVYEDYSAQAGH